MLVKTYREATHFQTEREARIASDLLQSFETTFTHRWEPRRHTADLFTVALFDRQAINGGGLTFKAFFKLDDRMTVRQQALVDRGDFDENAKPKGALPRPLTLDPFRVFAAICNPA